MASVQVRKAASPAGQPQNGAQATVVNQTSFAMTLGRSINWSGTPASPGFPDTILPNMSVMFNHLSDGEFGSTGAVIYDGFNPNMHPCAWVLAWDAPAESDQFPNKVYVDCGLKSVIDGIEFTEIRRLLRESSTESKAEDPVSKTKAEANVNDLTPEKATVAAAFGVMP
ncbi:jasmonate-induced protein homolog [Silene latifolia]|uniref:jasmonate-induced protein homolog n=1 Tax=Silene latifolia TaxID=37657 RepID=UPI003D786916